MCTLKSEQLPSATSAEVTIAHLTTVHFDFTSICLTLRNQGLCQRCFFFSVRTERPLSSRVKLVSTSIYTQLTTGHAYFDFTSILHI
jgi:hypothetical protein